MNKIATRWILLVEVAGSSLATAAPAYAQNNSGDQSNGNDIIVTARRSEERLQDVPISITVLSQNRYREPQHLEPHRSRDLRALALVECQLRPREGQLRDPRVHPGGQDLAVGRRLLRRRDRAARQRRHHLRQRRRSRQHVRSRERPGAEGPARHPVWPQHHGRRDPAGAEQTEGRFRGISRRLGRQLQHASPAGRAERSHQRNLPRPRRVRLAEARRIPAQYLGHRAQGLRQHRLYRRSRQRGRAT